PSVSATLSLHDALPIFLVSCADFRRRPVRERRLFAPARGGERDWKPVPRALALLAMPEASGDPRRAVRDVREAGRGRAPGRGAPDRKSTRLNSSHVKIS